MRAARWLLVAVLLSAVGAVTGLVATGRPWVREETRAATPTPERPDAFVVTTTTRDGEQVAPGSRALAVVSLAGSAATIGARGRGRRAVGVVLAATGAGSAVLAARAFDGPSTGAVVAACVGGVLVAAAGALTAVTGPSWPGLGARYDAPTAAPRDELADAWDATDRGEDPTDDDAPSTGSP